MADPVTTDAGQQVRMAIALCDRLDLADALTASRRFLERERQLGEAIRRAQTTARQQHGEAMRALVMGDGPVDADVVVAVLADTDPWLNVEASPLDGSAFPAPAVALLREAQRTARGHAYAVAAADSSGLYQRLQRVAAESVSIVARQPGVSRRTWGSPDPARQAMLDGYEVAWGVMTREQERFSLLHQLGSVLRGMGGLGASALLPGGAPAWGYAYRQWAKAMEGEQELKRLHPTLRLRFAIDHDWQPGLYLRDDLVIPEPEQGRRGLLGFLIPSPLRSG